MKGPCRAATTADITLAGEQTIDGVAVVSGDRVLVKNQARSYENGLYTVDTGDWSRCKDFSRNDDVVKGTRVVVTDGTQASSYQVSFAGTLSLGTTEISFSNAPGFDLAGAPLATSGVSSLLGVDGSGDIVREVNIARLRKYDVTNYSADPEVSAALNTLRIQQAFNEAGDTGHAEVFIPFRGDGLYKIQASSETTILGGIGAGAGGVTDPVYVGVPASSVVALLLPSGVHVICDDGVIIENQDTTKNILGFKNMLSGGIQGGWWRSTWDWASPDGHAGHGITAFCDTDPNNDPNMNLRFENMRISNVASYGLGMGMGFLRNNRYHNLWIHDVGADCIDHKSRPMTDGSLPIGNMATNIVTERYGRRAGIIASTSIDVRGPIIVDGLVAREVAYSTNQNVGVRLSAGVYHEGVSPGATLDYRWPSEGAILTNFNLDAGDPTISDTTGVAYLDSGAIVDTGHVRNFDLGITVHDATSGWGSNDGSLINNVTVEGARTTSFEIGSVRSSVINCTAFGQTERFEINRGNLAASQTVFVSPRDFDAAAVQVYKNDVLLTLTTHYTITGTDTITLTSGVLGTDIILIVSPTATGFDVEGNYTKLRNCRSRFCTTPRTVASGAVTTLDEGGNLLEGLVLQAEYSTSTSAISEARGDAADIERDIRAKGAAGVVMRSRGSRAFRAVNNVDNCVNWIEGRGSIAGAEVLLAFAGSDANGTLTFTGKGLGNVKVISSAYNGSHFQIGNYHLWVDSSGRLRIKSSAPTSDTDGAIVGTQL